MQWSTLLLAFAALTLTWAPLISVSAQEESSTVPVSSSTTSAATTASSSTVRPESLTSPTTTSSTSSSSPASSSSTAATTTTTTVPATSTTGAPEGNAKAAQATPTPAASLASSLLSGLFDTITTTKTSKDCPGKCVHVFAALLCEKVLDNVTCSEPSMRCCVENRSSPTRSVSTTKPPATSAGPTPAKTSASTAQVKATEATTTQTSTTTKSTTKPTTTKASTTAAATTTATTQKPTTTTTKAATTTTTTTIKPPTTTTTKPTTTTQKTTTTLKTAAPTTATTKSPTTTTENKETKADETTETSDDDDVLKASAITSLKVCPGVCVATRISDFCEAVLNVEGLCKTGMRCCVTKSLFGEAEPPPELVILNEASAVPSSSTEGSASSTTTTKTTTTTRPSITSTTTRPKPKPTTPSPNNDKRCKGTCVTGFFSYLCDYIDTKASCSNGGKCCISRRENGGGASSGETRNGTSTSARPASSPRPSSTTLRPSSTTTKPASTTTAKPSTTTTPAPLKRCPGVCLPGLMSAFCSKPSVIINDPPNLCERGSVCCDSKNRETPSQTGGASSVRPARPTARPPSNPMSDLLSNPLTSLLAGPLISSLANAALQRPAPASSGPEKSDASPSRPQATTSRPANNRPATNRPASRPTPQVPTSTTTTTTTTPAPQVVDTRPYCPGTCMAPILSFSCFGNAEITDLFRCPSSKVVCCAQKSAIRELRPALPPGVQEIPQTELNKPETGFRPPPMVRPPPPPASTVAAPPPSLQQPPPAVATPDAGRRPAAPRPVPHSKFVCGVKGTHREIRAASQNATSGYRKDRSADSTTISTYRKGRVVGGSDALPGEYCWQVALINSLNQYLCGGALIGTQWVLTAAHCVTNIVRSGDAIYVRVGDHDLTSRYGSPGAQTLRVATTYIHHNHNSQTLDNDIALLKLQGQAELKPGVCIICLPSRGAIPETGRRCTVTGYGYMGESGPIPLRVREAEVPVVSEGECVRQINAVTEKIFIMPASSFCAGGEAGNDACQGDGGGPLVCEDDGYFELTGLVSWGFGCGRAQVPGVYVKVSSFISWINQIISVNNV